jgi:hypothetical protein
MSGALFGSRRCAWVTRGAALFFPLFVVPASAEAHRLDEYMQATLVAIAPGDIRLQINLTPGVKVAERIIGLIDADGDGAIAPAEADAYAAAVNQDLAIRVDRKSVIAKVAAHNFPPPEELRTGAGIIQIELAVAPGGFGDGPHRLDFANGHLPEFSVYLFNAAQPSGGQPRIRVRPTLCEITNARDAQTPTGDGRRSSPPDRVLPYVPRPGRQVARQPELMLRCRVGSNL